MFRNSIRLFYHTKSRRARMVCRHVLARPLSSYLTGNRFSDNRQFWSRSQECRRRMQGVHGDWERDYCLDHLPQKARAALYEDTASVDMTLAQLTAGLPELEERIAAA
ncbi:hypothetical protein ASPZODRAFT_127152 [Penicilliopsis zonata CBS 506.65]|uniref:Uncharacterized protein n=1 Tax=Penicilliopsis zonata CBS 506.65 TaxID=1073090 RepID=A0A1L9SVP7_9EURO|nr:hypothetical protein ASPZODRAFT_127152 [Penicilliopsis zonata CBS 506.65]OJJ51133.1 hypothetical protein ASPZODRAFT_127152 [Penicilliopsis zonata CBS 506.65]